MQYRRAFVALRRDPRWKRKIALGVVIGLIPYLGMVWLAGWQMQYQRSVAWGNDELLPEWSDFKGQALLGLKAFVAVMPYSILLSFVLTGAYMAGAMLAGFAVAFDSLSAWHVLVFVLAMYVLVMVGTVLMLPLTSSVTLRVALYGTIESGFQLKEIWRLMRENKPVLLQAWGLTVVNIAIATVTTILYAGLVAVVVALAAGSEGGGPLLAIALGVLGYLAYFPLQMTLSMCLGVASTHFFGSYGQVAYRLGPVAELPAATPV